ncbi:hypothetical protein AADZ90_018625 [Aestuariibius sp. 2305UL40-4]|uniref:hypothetical protein n=1 Tax=Aestuariibius violaceus TaxID=3234132 RepID=UPI00345ED0F8
MFRYLIPFLIPATLAAEAPVIENATAERTGDTWRFDVTISHPDTGWDHYADGWEVLDANGNSLGLRTLFHPHVEEQPFTRSLTGVEIPDGTTSVFIRARCSVDGWSDERVEVSLTGS